MERSGVASRWYLTAIWKYSRIVGLHTRANPYIPYADNGIRLPVRKGVSGFFDSCRALRHTVMYWRTEVRVSGSERLSGERPVPDRLASGAIPCSPRTSTRAATL